MVKATGIIIDEKGNTISAESNLHVNTQPNAVENKEMQQAKKLLSKPIIKVYHGNKDDKLVPNFGVGKKNNDYGQGFYTTPDLELAKEWAWGTYTKGDQAYVHEYEIDISELKILNLTELDSLHWVAELFANRTININEKEALADTLKAFIKKYKLDTKEYDIIIGYRADDSYFRYAVDFLQSAIYRDTLDNALRYGNLGLQVFLKSEKAFKMLKKVKIIEVPEIYKIKYKKRDGNAIQEYNRLRKNQVSRKKETIHHFI